MNKIVFNKTSNIFINSGIVALYRYLRKYEMKNASEKLHYELLHDKLIVESENILQLLEDVYYFMGKDIYDTSTKKQLDKLENVYYDVQKDEFHRFPKIYTYGLAELLTNNAQGTTKIKENSTKIKNLEKEQPDVASKIKHYFEKNKLKLLSKVYLNEPYTKITTINLQDKYWKDGKEYCYLTGENFNSLVNAVNISPFIKGLTTFNSFLNSSDGKVSQKGMYLLRYSPALAMYSYYKGYDSFISSFFNSNSLIEINNLYSNEFFYENEIMQSWKMPFKRNIKLHNFSFARKGKEDYPLDSAEDSFSPQEITFLILLTFYKKKFADELVIQNINVTETTDILNLLKIDKSPISLITFKADKFASTLRPNFYEEYTNVKFVIQLIHKLETNKGKRVPIS